MNADKHTLKRDVPPRRAGPPSASPNSCWVLTEIYVSLQARLPLGTREVCKLKKEEFVKMLEMKREKEGFHRHDTKKIIFYSRVKIEK